MMWPFGKKPNAAAPGGAGTHQVLSILAPHEVTALGGLPEPAIIGLLEGKSFSPESFRPNPAFVDFMQRVIASQGPLDPGLQEAAEAQRDGYVYVIDLRTPEGPQGNVPPEDVIGGFAVRSGRIVPDSYKANPNYRSVTWNGTVRLPPTLREAFIRALPRVASRV